MITRIKPYAGRLALAVLGLAVASLSVTIDPASAVSERVVGKFQTEVVFGDECQAAAANVCAVGKATGNLNGAFTFGVSELTTAQGNPGVVRFAGDGTLETNHGTLTCRNAAALQTTPNTDGAFVSLCIVTGGTGAWEGATGYLQVRGTFSLSGGAVGEYVGRVTRT